MAENRPVEMQWRLRWANTVAATAFLIGGSLFAIGAALAQGGVDATVCATVYLVGARQQRKTAGAGGRASRGACSG
jgi:hypothetical protein